MRGKIHPQLTVHADLPRLPGSTLHLRGSPRLDFLGRWKLIMLFSLGKSLKLRSARMSSISVQVGLTSHGCVKDQILLRSGQDARNEQTITFATTSASLKLNLRLVAGRVVNTQPSIKRLRRLVRRRTRSATRRATHSSRSSRGIPRIAPSSPRSASPSGPSPPRRQTRARWVERSSR